MSTSLSTKHTHRALLSNGSLFYDYAPRALSSIQFSGAVATSQRTFAAAPPPPPPRPFRVLGLQQIAVGSLDKSPLSHLWTNVFGLTKVGRYESERENVDEDILVLGKEGSPSAVEVDLMVPIDPEKSPKVHVPPLNHVGLWVDDLPAAVAWMGSRGVRFTPGGIRKGASGHDVTFIHPKGNEQNPVGGEGVLIELVQAPKEVIDALS
ncbi:hypothetical protein ACHAWF_012482 [Thalassiosira exigua]